MTVADGIERFAFMPPTLHRLDQPAVDHVVRAGDVRGPRRGEQRDERRDLLRRGEAAGGDARRSACSRTASGVDAGRARRRSPRRRRRRATGRSRPGPGETLLMRMPLRPELLRQRLARRSAAPPSRRRSRSTSAVGLEERVDRGDVDDRRRRRASSIAATAARVARSAEKKLSCSDASKSASVMARKPSSAQLHAADVVDEHVDAPVRARSRGRPAAPGRPARRGRPRPPSRRRARRARRPCARRRRRARPPRRACARPRARCPCSRR